MRLDWQRGVLYATTMGMEVCWLYALVALLNERVAGGMLSVSGILLFYPLAFGGNKLLFRMRMPGAWAVRIVSWLMWAVLALMTIKVQLFGDAGWFETAWVKAIPPAIAGMVYAFSPELLILVITALVWWLGQRLSGNKLDFSASASEFQFGLVMLLIMFFVASMLEVELACLIPVALAFFLFALAGMSISHAREGRSWLSGLHQGRWMELLLAGIGLVLALGLVVGFVVTPELLQVVLDALKWLWDLIVRVLAFIAGLFPSSGGAPELPSALPVPEGGAPEESHLWSMPETLRSALRIVWVVVVAGFVLVALWRVSSQILDWLRRKVAGTEGSEFEPLEGAFRADLLRLLKMILRKLSCVWLVFRKGKQKSSLLPEVESVRQIYRYLLEWASAAGYPRQVSQTPYEYLHALAGVQPEFLEDMAFITHRYVSARYGSSVPDESELHQLKRSWHRIKKGRSTGPVNESDGIKEVFSNERSS
ncbi:MAG: DUF4129 domain-containing protein [Dehalococcoidia bacterium]|nr:DUF4129 domain-containing protein [Dehalococcoidia bacterium]